MANLQPLRMLIEHGVDNVDKRFVTGKETVASGEQISFKPTLTLMLAQDLHDATVGSEVIVVRENVGHPGPVCHLQNILPAIGVVLVRTEEPEVLRIHVHLHHVAKELSHHSSGFGANRTGARYVDGVGVKVGKSKIPEHRASVRVRIRAHSPITLGRESSDLWLEL